MNAGFWGAMPTYLSTRGMIPRNQRYWKGGLEKRLAQLEKTRPGRLLERPIHDILPGQLRDHSMAGHSQFKNIMFRKGRQDKERSKLFSKLSREITVAAKSGLPDPNHNPRLRSAILAAKAESMPKDNIERAIKKAIGGDAENYDEVRYEGRGPGGTAIIIEALTDNRNRTSADVRATFSKYGGQMGETGSVSFMFDHRSEENTSE